MKISGRRSFDSHSLGPSEPSRRAVPALYEPGVRLIRWLWGKSWMQRLFFRDRIERINGCLHAVGIVDGHAELIRHNLASNTWPGWRTRALSRMSPKGFARWVSVEDGSRWDDARQGRKGVILLLRQTPMAPLIFFLLERWGVEDSLCISAKKEIPFSEPEVGSGYDTQLDRARELLERGGVVVLAADGFERTEGCVPRPFFGKMCFITKAFAELAISLGSTVLPVDVSADLEGVIRINFGGRLDAGTNVESQEERFHSLVDRYLEILRTWWRGDFGNVSWDRMDAFLRQVPGLESMDYTARWRPDGKSLPLTIGVSGFSFLEVEYPDVVELDSSFEDIPGVYRVELIESLIEEHGRKYGKPVQFLSMNERNCNGRDIIYRNFAWGLYRDQAPPAYTDYRHTFTYLVGYPRPDKLEMLSALHREGLLDDALWSCGSYANEEGRCLPDLPKILDLDMTQKHDQRCWFEIQGDFYRHSRFSLVQETEMQDTTNRYTEKTYKCFRMKHPFILAGNYQTLDLLHRDGFETFHPHIDESYDHIRDQQERIKAIVEQVRALCKKTEEQWTSFIEEVQPILDHNFDVAVQKAK